MRGVKVVKKGKRTTAVSRGEVVNIDIDLADLARSRGTVEALILVTKVLECVRGRNVGDVRQVLKK